MNRLGQVLRAFFWLPILVAGLTGFAFVSPDLDQYRLPGILLLAVFILLGVLQTMMERRRSLVPEKTVLVAKKKRTS